MLPAFGGKGDIDFYCNDCNIRISNHTSCINHINYHRFFIIPKCFFPSNFDKILICQICNQLSSNLTTHLQHCWLEHILSPDNKSCPFCSTSFSSSKTLLQHVDVSCVFFKCSKCGKIINQELDYYEHNIQCINQGSSLSKFLTCDICEHQVTLDNVGLHILTHSLKMTPIRENHSLQQMTNIPKNTFLCEFCDEVFNDVRTFFKHKYGHRRQKFTCCLCNTYFETIKTVQNHLTNVHKQNISGLEMISHFYRNTLSCSTCKLSGFPDINKLVRHHILRCQRTPEQKYFAINVLEASNSGRCSFLDSIQSTHLHPYLDFGILAFASIPMVHKFLEEVKNRPKPSVQESLINGCTDVSILYSLDVQISTQFSTDVNNINSLESSKLEEAKAVLREEPGVCILPEPDFNRLIHFTKLIKSRCDNSKVNSIPEDVRIRLLTEAQYLREIEPFYIKHDIKEMKSEQTEEIKQLVEKYSDPEFVKVAIQNCESILQK